MDARPEVHAALALAARHQQVAVYWKCRRHRACDRLIQKHVSKAQKLTARAERLSREGSKHAGEV